MTRLVLAILMLAAVGCGKSDATEQSTEKAGESTPKAGADKAAEKGEAAAKAPASPTAGWKTFKQAKFEVLAPNTKPQVFDENMMGLKAAGWGFELAGGRGFGQVMMLDYQGPDAYDLEVGFDGAVKGLVTNIGGTMGRFEKKKDGDRVARQFDFITKVQGRPHKGVGRGVATGPKGFIIAVALWRNGDAAVKGLADAFVKSLVVK